MAPPRLRAATDDLPALEMLVVSLPAPPSPRLTAVPAPGRPVDRVARLGLALSVVLALVGAVSAVVKSGDDGTTRADTAGVVIHKPAPDTSAADEEADPSAVAIPDGYEVIRGEGISMAVPDSWVVLDPDDLHLTAGDIEDIYPDADEDVLANAVRVFERGAVLLAVDLSGEEAGYNVNVLTLPLAVPVGEMEELFLGELLGAGIEVLDSGAVVHPLRPAFRVSISSPVDGVDIPATQYYLPFDGATHIVTITGPSGDVADPMFDSFRVDGSGAV